MYSSKPELNLLPLYTGFFTLIYCYNLPRMPTETTFHGHCVFKQTYILLFAKFKLNRHKWSMMVWVSISIREKETQTTCLEMISLDSSSVFFLYYPNDFFNTVFIFLPLLFQKCLIELLRMKLFSDSHFYWCNLKKTQGYLNTKWGIFVQQETIFFLSQALVIATGIELKPK